MFKLYREERIMTNHPWTLGWNRRRLQPRSLTRCLKNTKTLKLRREQWKWERRTLYHHHLHKHSSIIKKRQIMFRNKHKGINRIEPKRRMLDLTSTTIANKCTDRDFNIIRINLLAYHSKHSPFLKHNSLKSLKNKLKRLLNKTSSKSINNNSISSRFLNT